MSIPELGDVVVGVRKPLRGVPHQTLCTIGFKYVRGNTQQASDSRNHIDHSSTLRMSSFRQLKRCGARPHGHLAACAAEPPASGSTRAEAYGRHGGTRSGWASLA